MNVTMHWGNLEALSAQKRVQELIEKQKLKLAKHISDKSSKTAFRFKYDNPSKKYVVCLTTVVPKDSFRIEKTGYTFEEALTEAVNDLRRTIRKSKEKVITMRRKTSLKSFMM